MSEEKIFTDEDLISFIDGSASKELVKDIKDSLKTNTALRQRLSVFHDETAHLKEAMDTLLVSSPEFPAELEEQFFHKSDVKAWSSFFSTRGIAAMLLTGFIGFASAFLIVDKGSSETWLEQVAVYQALYANNTLSHIELSEDQSKSGLARVSKALGKTIDHSVVSQIKEIAYKRAQILQFKDKPLIQMAYLTKLGVPVALCVIKTPKATNKAPEYNLRHNMRSANWSKDGYSYILIGGKDKELIERSAGYFYQNL